MTSGILQLYHESPSCWRRILQYLDLASLKSLRLAQKDLGGKLTEAPFKQYLETQTTDLSERSLRSLATLATHHLGTAVRRVRLIATIYSTAQVEEILETGERAITRSNGVLQETEWSECTEEELGLVQSDLAWLQAKRIEQESWATDTIISSLSSTLKLLKCLKRLELDAEVYVDPKTKVSTMSGEWAYIWNRASWVYQVAMSALAKGGIELESLNVYGNTPRCSVPIRQLAEHAGALESDDFGLVGASIKKLCLSICGETSTPKGTDGDTESEQGSQSADRAEPGLGVSGVADLLVQMPNLQTLDIHLYLTGNGDQDISRSIFSAVASTVRLKYLQRCAIRGIYTDQSSMLQFLKAHPAISELELAHVRIESDWPSVIAQLTALLPMLSRLQLSGLWDKALMNLEPNWSSPAVESHRAQWGYPVKSGWQVFKVVLEGSDVQKTNMGFKPRPGGRQLGSPEFRKWMLQRRREYGPP